jgi:large subunit ribosomal protein L9
MSRGIKLLLIENVDNLGIVGDVVNVRTGYARNFLLPRNLATEPSDQLVKDLAGKRAEAQKEIAEQRKQREVLATKVNGAAIKLVRSCNDQGILYASITQQDVATALNEQGYAVKPRDVRISQTIKRVDSYELHIKLDSDLDSIVKLTVEADRKLDLDHADDHKKGDGKGEGKSGASAGAEGQAAEGADAKDGAKAEGKSDAKEEGRKSDGKSDGRDGGRREGGDGDKPRKREWKKDRSDAPPKAQQSFLGEERKIVKWSSGSSTKAADVAESKADKAKKAAAKKSS